MIKIREKSIFHQKSAFSTFLHSWDDMKISFFLHTKAANSVVSIQIWPKFKLVQASMHVVITCKYQKDQIKSNQEVMETPSSPL